MERPITTSIQESAQRPNRRSSWLRQRLQQEQEQIKASEAPRNARVIGEALSDLAHDGHTPLSSEEIPMLP